MNSNFGIGFAINQQGSRDFNVRVFELRQLLFPIRVLELEKECADYIWIVECGLRKGFHVIGGKFDTRGRVCGRLIAAWAESSAPSTFGTFLG